MTPSLPRKRLPADLAAHARRRLDLLHAEAGGWVPDVGATTSQPAPRGGHSGTGEAAAENTESPSAGQVPDPDDGAIDVLSAQLGSPPPGDPDTGVLAALRAALADRVPVALRGGGIAISGAAAAGLALVAALSVAFAVSVLWRGRVEAVPVVPPTVLASPASGALSPSASPRTPSAAGSAQPGSVVVDVEGRVRRPGLATLPAGARVGDALRSAGGVVNGGQTIALNLARVLADGEQLYVPGRGERPASAPAARPGTGAGPANSAAPATPPATADPLLDLNAATLEELDGLPGVGPVLAQRILDWRTEHGKFSSIDELREVSGIGASKFGDIRHRVRV